MSVVDDWVAAEAGCAARLPRLAGRLGALDDRLRRGPQGWRHRLALLEAADLSWLVGDRVGLDRLASWMSLRLSGTDDDMGALARVGWVGREGRTQRSILPRFLTGVTPRTSQMRRSYFLIVLLRGSI